MCVYVCMCLTCHMYPTYVDMLLSPPWGPDTLGGDWVSQSVLTLVPRVLLCLYVMG